MIQYSFTSTETRRLVRTVSPGRPPRFSHSSWTMIKSSVYQRNFISGTYCYRFITVILPLRDLRQPTQNITYFVSVVRKMRTARTKGKKIMEKLECSSWSTKSADENSKKSGNGQKICRSQRVWIDRNFLRGIIFSRSAAADDVGNPSSRRLPRDLVTRWSWNRGCRHFLSFIFGVNARFVVGFVVFYIWVNSDIRWQLD